MLPPKDVCCQRGNMEQPKLRRDTHDVVTDVLLVGLFPFLKKKAILSLEAQTVYLIFQSIENY